MPSPGSTWNRKTRRRGGWHPSTVGGDPKRGIGLLNNEAYIGRRVWNRSKWIKDLDTGKRRQVPRPQADWIIREDGSLRIVPQPLWDRVKARQRIRSEDVGSRIKAGRRSPGRAPRYLFSGLLKCELCGSSMVTSDGRGYMCSGYLNGRICTNRLRAPRLRAEARLLATIKRDLLRDSAIAEFKRRLRRAMARPDPNAQTRKRLEAEVEHVTDAIAKELLSPALARRLQEAESALKALPAAPIIRLDDVMRVLPQAVERYAAWSRICRKRL